MVSLSGALRNASEFLGDVEHRDYSQNQQGREEVCPEEFLQDIDVESLQPHFGPIRLLALRIRFYVRIPVRLRLGPVFCVLATD